MSSIAKRVWTGVRRRGGRSAAGAGLRLGFAAAAGASLLVLAAGACRRSAAGGGDGAVAGGADTAVAAVPVPVADVAAPVADDGGVPEVVAVAAAGGAPTPDPTVRFASVSAGFDATCAVAKGGDLYCWGGRDRPNRPTEPVLREVVQVASGWEHVCAAKNDGTLWCWGGNVHGQLGLGTLGVHTRRDAPAQVALERVQSVSASWKHTCAATALGELYCWGDGSHGRLGTGDAETRAEPTKVELEGVVAVAVGEEHSCAIQADTGLSCWGYNFSGQLGLGENWAEKPSCTKKEQDYVLDCLRPESLGMPTVSSFATGGSHTCAILGGSTLSCWGWNADEQLGVASPESSWTALPVTGIGWGRVTQVSASRTATCAVAGVGELYCWGDGSLGRLGLGENSGRRPPTRLALEGVAQVSVGYAHACALTRDGALWCWGSNAAGQLGLGDGWLSRPGCLREKYTDEGRGRGERDVSLEYCVGPQPVTVGP